MKKILSQILILNVLILSTGCASPLISAIRKGDVVEVKDLLHKGVELNVKNEAIVSAAWDGKADIVKILLENGTDVNARDSMGASVLFNAAMNGHADIVKFLIDKGADVNATNNNGHPPLAFAGYMKGNQSLIMKILIEHGAEIDTAMVSLERLAVKYPDDVKVPMAIKFLEKFVKKKEIEPTTPEAAAQNQILTAKKSDIDELPTVKAKPNKNAYAIVIGIEEYRQKLPKADFAVADAKAMTEYLTKVMGYSEENVVTLINDRAAKSDFEKYFEKWLFNNVEKDGNVFIYYSGHGAPNPKTGDAFLVPYDGDPAFIDQTGYSLKRLYENLGKLQVLEVTVVLDACFSGAGGRSVITKGARPLVMTMEKTAIPSNVAVLSAASGDQISSTYEEKGHGLFTYFMLKGIKGEGDINGDGKIEIRELFEYLKPQVERVARKTYNNEQSPQIIAPTEKHKMILIEGAK